jgi:hypothetical protein
MIGRSLCRNFAHHCSHLADCFHFLFPCCLATRGSWWSGLIIHKKRTKRLTAAALICNQLECSCGFFFSILVEVFFIYFLKLLPPLERQDQETVQDSPYLAARVDKINHFASVFAKKWLQTIIVLAKKWCEFCSNSYFATSFFSDNLI